MGGRWLSFLERKGIPAKLLCVSCGWMSYGQEDHNLRTESLFGGERQACGPGEATPSGTFLGAFIGFSLYGSAMATFSHKHWIKYHARKREKGKNLEIQERGKTKKERKKLGCLKKKKDMRKTLPKEKHFYFH